MQGLIFIQIQFLGKSFILFVGTSLLGLIYPVIRCPGNNIIIIVFDRLALVYLVNSIIVFLLTAYVTRRKFIMDTFKVFDVNRVNYFYY